MLLRNPESDSACQKIQISGIADYDWIVHGKWLIDFAVNNKSWAGAKGYAVYASAFNKALVFSILNRHKEALDAYNRALQLFPNDPMIWNNKGLSLLNLKISCLA